jgi:hypothetical protein
VAEPGGAHSPFDATTGGFSIQLGAGSPGSHRYRRIALNDGILVDAVE